MKPVNDFIKRLHAEVEIDEALIIRSRDRYFLLNDELKKLIGKDFFHAGTYLGKTKGGRFFPSFTLLAMMIEGKANKVVVDDRTEWLFVCGRDVFREGIKKVVGASGRGEYALVLNRHGECIGFGRMLRNLDREDEGVAIKNVSDIGDFLRRERR